jgi:hypothetical protein
MLSGESGILVRMPIRQQEPVFTIGKAPLVVGTIVYRNYVRARRQQEKQLRWNALTSRLLFRRTVRKKQSLPFARFNGHSDLRNCSGPFRLTVIRNRNSSIQEAERMLAQSRTKS